MSAVVLTLSILRCPEGTAPETRRVPVQKFSIGRGPDNDWVLTDPERHLSKRHCTLAWQGEFWQLADLSANGTYLNGEAEPIGPGRARDLRDGDRLRLGAYEIELGIEADRPGATPSMGRGELDQSGPDDSLLSKPLFAEPPLAFAGPVQSDHRPGIEDAFVPARPIALLADDWDLDVPGMPEAAPAPPAAFAPALTPEPAARPAPAPAGEDADDLLAAFMRGAGVPESRPADPAAAMAALGRAFRAMVGGLRETLIARAAVKSEFRIEQTLIRARGNNPLKFAATDDDALAALLGTGRHAGMTAEAAVSESLRDLRLHEVATMTAMQSAVRSLLRELAPAKLREESGAGGLLAAQRKARSWDAYEALHARVTQALADDFDSVFGRAFARAYEQAWRETAERNKPDQA